MLLVTPLPSVKVYLSLTGAKAVGSEHVGPFTPLQFEFGKAFPLLSVIVYRPIPPLQLKLVVLPLPDGVLKLNDGE